MRIREVDLDREVLVVAEIGNNHEGDVEAAKELVRRAAGTGAGAVKFQTFSARDFVRRSDQSRYEMMSRFELSPAVFAELQQLAVERGLLFISTPLDLRSVEVLAPLVDCFKIASGDNDHFPLIERIARTGKPVILSTGLANLDDVETVIRTIRSTWAREGIVQDLAILHCVTSYPVPPEQANVAAVTRLRDAFDVTVGYSDHTLGIEACVLAVALGARVIEKHFTLDKRYSAFRDHALSADPPEMAELVRRVRLVRTLSGTGEKVAQPSELALILAVRRSIVAAADLTKGHVIGPADLTWMRPGGGLRPGQEPRLLRRRLRRDVAQGENILLDDLE